MLPSTASPCSGPNAPRTQESSRIDIRDRHVLHAAAIGQPLTPAAAGARVNRKVRIVARPRMVADPPGADALHEGAVNVGLRRRDIDGIFTAERRRRIDNVGAARNETAEKRR